MPSVPVSRARLLLGSHRHAAHDRHDGEGSDRSAELSRPQVQDAAAHHCHGSAVFRHAPATPPFCTTQDCHDQGAEGPTGAGRACELGRSARSLMSCIWVRAISAARTRVSNSSSVSRPSAKAVCRHCTVSLRSWSETRRTVVGRVLVGGSAMGDCAAEDACSLASGFFPRSAYLSGMRRGRPQSLSTTWHRRWYWRPLALLGWETIPGFG
jgi:hypothetical protein